jgi:ATP-dependent DNA ligase
MRIQKVLSLSDALEKKSWRQRISGVYLIQQKFDGNYLYADYTQGVGWDSLRSSSQRILPSLQHIQLGNHISTPTQHMRFIFEGILEGADVHEISGTLNRHEACTDSRLKLMLHDVVPLEESLRLQVNTSDRYKLMQQIRDTKLIKKVQVLGASEYGEEGFLWRKVFDQVVDRGGEGIICRQTKAIYLEGKRNESLLKMKMEATLDLLCESVLYSFGKKGNPSMNLLLRDASGGTHEVLVPKLEDQEKFKADASAVVGKVVEVKCMKKLAGGSLREPRFIRTRLDKHAGEID